jgi:hypothetical protein
MQWMCRERWLANNVLGSTELDESGRVELCLMR